MLVTRRDVVRGALWLVVTLIAVAVLYVTLAADLIAVVQVLVYVGAVIVLFLFVIMLLAAGREPNALRDAGPGKWAAIGVAVGLLALVLAAAFSGELPQLQWSEVPAMATAEAPGIGVVADTVVPSTHSFGSPAHIGQALFSAQHVLTLELVSVLLVAAMVGVIVLAKGLRHGDGEPDTAGRGEA